jgi:hypothetical protein
MTVETGRKRHTNAELAVLDALLIDLVEEYNPITVRGTFYQMEVRDHVEKSERGYDLVQRRLVKLRRSGAIPYSHITDGSRLVRGHDRYDGVGSFQAEMASLYRRDYWSDEDVLVEVWIEKDALAGTIYPVVCEEWGLDLYINRGFTSHSYLYGAARTILAIGKPAHIYVLSDFDPSGKCAAHKVAEGLEHFVGDRVEVNVYDLAVTEEQIAMWSLPSRPTKVVSRTGKLNTHYRKFAETYGEGTRSVELDAIRPDLLRGLVSEAIAGHWSDPRRLEVLKMTEEEERRNIASLRLKGKGR